jgi:hypothetical protein
LICYRFGDMLRALSNTLVLPVTSRALRHFTQPASTSSKYTSKPARKWRNELKYRVRQSFKEDASSEDQPVFAGIILERYPICFPDPEPSRLEFQNWSKKWNAWKYKVAKEGWLDCHKPIADEDSPEV